LSEHLNGGSGHADHVADADSVETKEWVDSLLAVVREGGPQRGLYLVNELQEQLRRQGIRSPVQPYSAYLNTIPLDRQGPYPGDLALGTDGFGRSDTRAVLREFFEVDRCHIAVAAIAELVREGLLDAKIQQAAITRYGVDVERAAPWTI
jgi:pyruvate dehydrogenase complex dehydrogenase (E1) component